MLASRHIKAISALEQQALARRSSAEKISDFIVYQAGRVWAILLHVAWFGIWIVWNSGRVPGLHPFDPFPFMGLSTALSLEAIFLSVFVLVSQNRQGELGDRRAELDLQINLLDERETTRILALVSALARKAGIDCSDPELDELTNDVEPEQVLNHIEKNQKTIVP